MRGHQKKSSTLEGRLKIVADNLANDHYGLATNQQSQETPPFMPNRRIQTSFGGTAYTSKITREASRHYHVYNTETYISKKIDLPANKLHLVDWESIISSINQLKINKIATRANLVYIWNFTATRGHMYDEEIPNTCPLCELTTETNAQISMCGCETVIIKKEQTFNTLKKQLHHIGTYPTIMLYIHLILSKEKHTEFRPTDTSGKFGESLLDKIIHDQTQIEWKFFEFGWWSKS